VPGREWGAREGVGCQGGKWGAREGEWVQVRGLKVPGREVGCRVRD